MCLYMFFCVCFCVCLYVCFFRWHWSMLEAISMQFMMSLFITRACRRSRLGGGMSCLTCSVSHGQNIVVRVSGKGSVKGHFSTPLVQIYIIKLLTIQRIPRYIVQVYINLSDNFVKNSNLDFTSKYTLSQVIFPHPTPPKGSTAY